MISEPILTVDYWLKKANSNSTQDYEVCGENAIAQTIVRMITELPGLSSAEQLQSLSLLLEIASIISQAETKFDLNEIYSQGITNWNSFYFDSKVFYRHFRSFLITFPHC